MGTVLVVGSINADVLLRVDARPAPGETVLATSAVEACGGKGANQAVAAARAGAVVLMAGAVGDDPRGHTQVDALRAAGVDTSLVVVEPSAPTGLAVVTVTPDGENSIVVASGANALVGPIDTGQVADVVVAQTEIPAVAVDSAVSLGRRFVLNPAPVVELAPATLAAADPLVVNVGEAAELLRRLGGSGSSGTALRAATGARSVVVTSGAGGAEVVTDDVLVVPAPRVEAVDTTGAGDVLVGALAAALADGVPLVDAVRAAVRAASESVTRIGAR